MKSERQLKVTKYKDGFVIAGQCSVCHRPFEVDFTIEDSLSSVEETIKTMFEEHSCNEDPNQAAALYRQKNKPRIS